MVQLYDILLDEESSISIARVERTAILLGFTVRHHEARRVGSRARFVDLATPGSAWLNANRRGQNNVRKSGFGGPAVLGSIALHRGPHCQ